MKVVCIIQARLASTRLPKKVLADLRGRPLLWRVVERAKKINGVEEVVVVVPRCDLFEIQRHVPIVQCLPGSPIDVLDRYHHAARDVDADVVIRVTGDCPLLSPEFAGEVVGRFVGTGADYVHNSGPNTDGLDAEAFTRKALDAAWWEADDRECWEHVGPFFLRNRGRFGIQHVDAPTWWPGPKLSVDTKEDLGRVRRIYERLAEGRFSLRDTLAAWELAGRP